MATLTDLTDPARERLDEARRLAASTGGQLRDRADDLRDRADDLRDRLPELREDLDPVVRRARVGLWEALRVLVSALLVLPRVAVRALGVTAEAVTVLTGQRARVAERAREAAHRFPEPTRVVVRRRLRTGVLVTAAFVVGAALGWLLARSRSDDELRFDAPQPPLGAAVNGARPVAAESTPSAPDAGTGDLADLEDPADDPAADPAEDPAADPAPRDAG